MSAVKVIFLVMLYCLLMESAQAGSTKAHLHGKVISVPCYINNKTALDFDFQRMGIKRIDGIRYAVSLDIPIQCDKDINARLFLKIRSQAVSATQTHVMKTDVDNLNIALFDEHQNKELPLNSEIEIDKTQTFRIKAVPVKEDPNKTLEAKPFTVMATMVAYYE